MSFLKGCTGGLTKPPRPVSALTLLHEEQLQSATRPCLLPTNVAGIGNGNGNEGENDNHHHRHRHRHQQQPQPSNEEFQLPIGFSQLAGPAGSGKTQLALSLCIDCVLNDQKAVYICLGGSNELGRVSGRLRQMLQSRLQNQQQHQPEQQEQEQGQHQQQISNGEKEDFSAATISSSAPTSSMPSSIHDKWIEHYLSRIFVLQVCNTDDLMSILERQLVQLLHQNNQQQQQQQQEQQQKDEKKNHGLLISVVILDGIAKLFRAQEEIIDVSHTTHHHDYYQRSVSFFIISSTCKRLSSTYQCPFLVINEVTTKFQTIEQSTFSVQSSSSSSSSSFSTVEPALGLSWSQCVNASFFVTRCSLIVPQQQEQQEDEKIQRDNANNNNNSNNNNKWSCNNNNNTNKKKKNNMMMIRSYRQIKCMKSSTIGNETCGYFYIDTKGIVVLRSTRFLFLI